MVPTLFIVIFTNLGGDELNQTFSMAKDSLILFTFVDSLVFKICCSVERLEFDQATTPVPKMATPESIMTLVTMVLSPLERLQ